MSCPSSIWRWDSNLQPLEFESPPKSYHCRYRGILSRNTGMDHGTFSKGGHEPTLAQ